MAGVTPGAAWNAPTKRYGGRDRPPGGMRTRFVGTSHHGNKDAASLDPGHPALSEGRTIFQKSVVSPDDAPRVLVSGHNNAKLGRVVEKGAWAGMPIWQLTLEERATCPRSCHNWRACFGNAMPFSRRHRHGPELVAVLDRELREHARQSPHGFVVRLHVLGDFYEPWYVSAWARWMLEIPQLHVFGYTARRPATEIGELIAAMNGTWPDRWVVRFSGEADAPPAMGVCTVWNDREGAPAPLPPATIMCPQSAEKTASCATCAMCWNPALIDRRIAFLGHGMNDRRAT